MHFFCNPLIFRTPFFGFFSSKMPFHGKMPIKVQKAPSWMQVYNVCEKRMIGIISIFFSMRK